MTQRNTWSATLAPIGVCGQTGQTIDPECVITVRYNAPIVDPDGTPIGVVDAATILDGHLVVTGTLDSGRNLPNALPTFDVSPYDRLTFDPFDGDDGNVGKATFHTIEINTVRTGFKPAWPDDTKIRFSNDWCVYVPGPDDLIPMPDKATADRAAIRFNQWWKDYRTRRCNDDGVDLPDIPAAIVRPWPYDTDGHAEALAELRADDPDGWLSE
jgi:hypothetical protein